MNSNEQLHNMNIALTELYSCVEIIIKDLKDFIDYSCEMETAIREMEAFFGKENAEAISNHSSTTEETDKLKKCAIILNSDYCEFRQAMENFFHGNGLSNASKFAVQCVPEPETKFTEEYRKFSETLYYGMNEITYYLKLIEDKAAREHIKVDDVRLKIYESIEKGVRLRNEADAFFDQITNTIDSYNDLGQGFIDAPRSFDANENDNGLAIDKLRVSAISPRKFVAGEYAMIKLVLYEHEYREYVEEVIETMDVAVTETKSGVLSVQNGAKIKIVLSSQDVKIDDNTEECCWNGEYAIMFFSVFLPENYSKRQILFKASIYVNGVIASSLKFIANCMSGNHQELKIQRKDILSAFISYASQDRNKVATMIHGMKKARPEMSVFFDVNSIRSGENWENAIKKEIEQSDTLFLCWSNNARISEWVEREWKYSLLHKGIDSIEPIPLEHPESCPPPIELAEKHFNDSILYIINS